MRGADGLKIAALHRPLYKVYFIWGQEGGTVSARGRSPRQDDIEEMAKGLEWLPIPRLHI